MGSATQMHSWPCKAQTGFQLPWTLSCPCAVNDSHHGGPGPRSPNLRKTRNAWQLLRGGPRHGLPSNERSLSLPGPGCGDLPFTVTIKHESHGRKHLPTTVVTLASPATSFRVIWWEIPGITNGGEEEGSQTKDHFLPLGANQPAIPCRLPDFAVDRCEGDQSRRAHPPRSLLGMLITSGSTTEWGQPPRS